MSYSSQPSGFLHPSQYPQQVPQQPPYPTTPGAVPALQPQAYFPPAPQQQQPMYSSSPSSQLSQPFYSSSPTAQFTPSPTQPGAMMIPQEQQPRRHRGSSSSTHSDRPQFQPQFQPQYASSAPIPIAHPHFYQPSSYPRHSSHSSSGSHHGHHHAYADDDDEPQQRYGELDEDTLREYEARYRKDRKLERRPTLGDSVMSMVGKVGGLFGSDRR